jgi:hypothetical protein
VGLLARGQAFINRVFRDMEPVAVSYSRVVGGATRTAALTAWVGNTLFAGLEEQSVSVQWGELDVMIVAADLVLPTTGLTTPHAGDRLAFTHGGVACTFEVSSPDTGEPAWRPEGQYRTRYRVHLKRVPV